MINFLLTSQFFNMQFCIRYLKDLSFDGSESKTEENIYKIICVRKLSGASTIFQVFFIT
jgi:hypothetical protein